MVRCVSMIYAPHVATAVGALQSFLDLHCLSHMKHVCVKMDRAANTVKEDKTSRLLTRTELLPVLQVIQRQVVQLQ